MYPSFTFVCHKTLFIRSFSLLLTSVVRKIRWFPDGIFLQCSKNITPLTMVALERGHQETCIHSPAPEKGREVIWIVCAMLMIRTSYHPQPGCSWISYLFYISPRIAFPLQHKAASWTLHEKCKPNPRLNWKSIHEFRWWLRRCPTLFLWPQWSLSIHLLSCSAETEKLKLTNAARRKSLGKWMLS